MISQQPFQAIERAIDMLERSPLEGTIPACEQARRDLAAARELVEAAQDVKRQSVQKWMHHQPKEKVKP